jgi:hypothetical protein
MITAMGQILQMLRKSLTWDQGPEMAEHLKIADALDLDIYFCDPASPHGSEAATKHQWAAAAILPQGHRPVELPPDYLAFVAAELNNRPRKTLGWKTPAEAFLELLSTHHPSLRRALESANCTSTNQPSVPTQLQDQLANAQACMTTRCNAAGTAKSPDTRLIGSCSATSTTSNATHPPIAPLARNQGLVGRGLKL